MTDTVTAHATLRVGIDVGLAEGAAGFLEGDCPWRLPPGRRTASLHREKVTGGVGSLSHWAGAAPGAACSRYGFCQEFRLLRPQNPSLYRQSDTVSEKCQYATFLCSWWSGRARPRAAGAALVRDRADRLPVKPPLTGVGRGLAATTAPGPLHASWDHTRPRPDERKVPPCGGGGGRFVVGLSGHGPGKQSGGDGRGLSVPDGRRRTKDPAGRRRLRDMAPWRRGRRCRRPDRRHVPSPDHQLCLPHLHSRRSPAGDDRRGPPAQAPQHHLRPVSRPDERPHRTHRRHLRLRRQ